MLIDKINKEIICSIRLQNETWHFYDCNGDELREPSKKSIFSSAMKKRYLKKRKNKQIDISTVWILVGIIDENKKICEQVGRTKDLINSLNEIKDNVKDFFYDEDGKYGVLRQKNYKELIFYEVDIDKYIEKDKLFIELYGNAPDNVHLSSAYYFIRAAYVEGKLGCDTSASMYHKSSLDGYFYDYYKKKG